MSGLIAFVDRIQVQQVVVNRAAGLPPLPSSTEGRKDYCVYCRPADRPIFRGLSKEFLRIPGC
jgi:hypothetical protein